MKVVVVGGGGFLGSRAVAALRKLNGVEVSVASRKSGLRVDLADRSSFEVLRGADMVVDLADTTSTRPDELAAWCLEEGLVFIETTSDLLVIDRLLQQHRGKTYPGTLVLGAGIFTGLSNLLVAQAVKEAQASCVRLGIRTSPFSGAGTGTVALMAGALSVDAVSFVDHKRVNHPPASRGPQLTFASGQAPTLRIPMPEACMIPLSTGVAKVDVFFSPKPAILVFAFLSLPMMVLKSRFFAWYMRQYFGFLRRFLLVNRASSCEMVVEAEGASKVSLRLSTADGMNAGGVAIAAIVAELGALLSIPKGVVVVDEVLALGPVVARMHTLANPQVVSIT